MATTVVYTLRLVAGRVQHLTSEADELTRRIRDVLADHAPQLLQRPSKPDLRGGQRYPA